MLCKPASYEGHQSALASFKIHSGELVSLRYVSVDFDLEQLFEKFAARTLSHWDLSGLLQQYRTSLNYMAGSHTSQAFFVCLDQERIFQIEIDMPKRHLLDIVGYTPVTGDFMMRLAGGNWDFFPPPTYIAALRVCLHYFFGFEEVIRILIQKSDLHYDCTTDILMPAGFLTVPGNPCLLYVKDTPSPSSLPA